MDNNDLNSRRNAALLEDKCFTKGRLRDEFRMKPAPDAEPVKWYKSSYGGKYGVYRIADCIPMREKRAQTEKQQQASARLAVQASLKSKRGRCAIQAHSWLSQEPLFLDTETTGLNSTAEALEIGLVDARGCTVYETRLKPTVIISPEAMAIHGIDEATLAGSPSWPDVAKQLQFHIGKRPLIIFNAGFDTRILKQTAAAHNEPADWLNSLTIHCAMILSARYYGATNRYGTISLANAASHALRPAWFWLTVMNVFRYTAIRQNQLLHIRLGDINLEERWIDLNIEGAKNHREHRVPIVSALYPSLEYLVRRAEQAGMEQSNQVFNVGWFDLVRKNKYPEVMNEFPLRAFFRRLSRECKFTISPHRFRHTVATHLMKSPERNLYAVKKLLGHVGITSTLEYIDENVDSLRNMLETELM